MDPRVKKLLEIKDEIGLLRRKMVSILEAIASELKQSEELRNEIGDFDVRVVRDVCGNPGIVISVDNDLEVVGWKILKFVESKYGIELDAFISLERC